MTKLIATALLMLTAHAALATNTLIRHYQLNVRAPSGTCPQTSGPLALRASQTRLNGISPLLVFFDATATTDSSITGSMNAFQDVTYTWDFGDGGTSGTGTWAYGSRPGANSRNTATGAIAAHLYITSGADTPYTATVTATDISGNTVSCTLGVAAYDPSGSNGFAGTKTTCASASGTPTAGSGGCPAGAAVLNTTSFGTALGSTHFGSTKRVLFKCGDTFTGTDTAINAVTAAVGAYGGCEGTQTSRPIMNSSSTATGVFMIANTAGDIRISDLDCEGGGTGGSCVNTPGGTVRVPYQITLSNLKSSGNHESYAYNSGAQWGLIELVQTGATGIGTFLNYAENNPTLYAGNPFNNINYQALVGSSITGIGCCGTGSGIETVRISACVLCVIEDNTITDANNIGAVLKLHNGNTYNSLSGPWTGVWTELMMITDNFFGGNSGGQLVEIAPQNGGDDERLRNIVVERNLFKASTQAQGGVLALVSAQNVTLRDNVFDMLGPDAFHYPILGIQGAQRGGSNIAATNLEAYNNTCYAPGNQPNQTCIGFDTIGSRASAASNSVAKNNLYFVSSASGKAVVDNTGSGNTVSNNSPNIALDPAFTNGSSGLSIISDFKPTANYSGAATVPVISDALNVLWSGSYSLGAVKP